GRTEDAAQAYAAMLRAEPGNPEIAARLSAVLARSPEQLKAWLESTQPATDGAKEDSGDVPLRALLLETAGRHAEALRLLRESTASHPDRGDVALSLALRLEGNDREMKEWLDKAVALDPSSPWPHLHKGLFLLKSGDGSGARREAEAAKAIAPRLPEAFQLAGSAARVEADYRAGVEQLSQALLLDPSDSLGVSRVQLALAYAGEKNGPASRQALEGDLPPFSDLIYRLAWAFVDRNFLDRTARGASWQPMRDAFADPNAKPAQAYAAVAASLASLGDPYTRLRSATETEALYVRGRLEKMVTDASGAPSPASSAVVTGDLGNDIGYLRLTTFSDPSAREAIRKALEQMAEKQGLVLDLRGNLGGLAAEADAVAGMLLEEGETLGVQRTGTGEEVQKIPQTRPAFPRKPLVILTDRKTGSAAEKLAAGLQGSGRATILGETTLGKGAGQMSRLLPGGAMLLVTAVESLTPSGEAIQGRGVVPDVPAEGDESLEKAREILEKPPTPAPPTP
ncbi:MAG TPA: S41 family peptidase, partial [Candidatus Polarisedimenticolia bacterium]|nr:S41 family peptidase [Candidatus Polarisedimenticolia bacterium]